MQPQARIFENTTDKELFDPQLGVTLPAHDRVSITTAYHNAPSKQGIIDITDKAERHTPESIAEHDRLMGRVPEAAPQTNSQEGEQNAQQ